MEQDKLNEFWMVVLIEFMLKLHSVSGLAKWSLSLADKQTNNKQ